MSTGRLGLFHHIYIRVIAVIATTLTTMLVFSHFHQSRALIEAWRQDLQQEVEWIAAHMRSDTHLEEFVTAWQSMHDGLRLQIYDANAQIVADSLQGAAPLNSLDGSTIVARAVLNQLSGSAELVLSRSDISKFPDRIEIGLTITAFLLFLIAAGLLLPLTHRVTQTFKRISTLASRVAEGQFGATIPEDGDRDLVALISSFNDMSRSLRDAELRNGRILVDVSHEFRSPLARLTALVDTVERHPEESGELLSRLRDELELLDRLTGDTLSGARFPPAKSELQKETVAFAKWADQAFARLNAGLRDSSVRFVANNRVDENATAYIDPQRMMQALGNLFDNANNALDGRMDGFIEVEAEIIDKCAVLRVSDNGPGIEEKELPFVLDRYYRGNESNRDQTGLGLGLSIAQELVAAHDGRLMLRSRDGGGVIAEICPPII